MTFGEIANALTDDPVVARYCRPCFRQVAEQLRTGLPNSLALPGYDVAIVVGLPLAEAADDHTVVGSTRGKLGQQLPAPPLEGCLLVASLMEYLCGIDAGLLAVVPGKELRQRGHRKDQ